MSSVAAATKPKKEWIQAHPSGTQVWVTNPSHSSFDIVDIAHHLSMQCRYAGGVERYYSVAEHSCHVLELMERSLAGDPWVPAVHRSSELAWTHWIERDLRRWALVHDASEAYLGDVTRPLKHQDDMAGYRRVEGLMQRRLAEWFGITPYEPRLVKELDTFILGTEARRLKQPIHPEWHKTTSNGHPLPLDVFPKERFLMPWRKWGWRPEKAKAEFLRKFEGLFGPARGFRAGGRP